MGDLGSENTELMTKMSEHEEKMEGMEVGEEGPFSA